MRFKHWSGNVNFKWIQGFLFEGSPQFTGFVPSYYLLDAQIKDMLSWGAGPRASQYLILGAKAVALLRGKYSPDIAEVREVATSVLRHRIVPSFTAEAEGITADDIIKKLL